MIFLSPDAAGNGWYIDPAPSNNTAFAPSLPSSALSALPGSAAYGHDDLLTTLEHEIGHILAFYPGDPGYASHLETVNGMQEFVGAGFSAMVAPEESSTRTFIPTM